MTKMRLPKHLWWEIPVQPPYKRCRYFFELQAGAERVFYFEDGFHSPEDVKNGQLGQCFTFPWMNSADINVTPKVGAGDGLVSNFSGALLQRQQRK